MNLPNFLTLLRVLMIPFFIFFMNLGNRVALTVALLIFCLASLTDALDGYLARKNHQVTSFGELMDPLADKLLVLAALLTLADKDLISSTFIFIIIGREFMVTGLRTVLASEGKIMAAANSGKIKTVVQIAFVIFAIASLIWPINKNIVLIFAVLTLLTTVYSGFEYFWKNRNMLHLR